MLLVLVVMGSMFALYYFARAKRDERERTSREDAERDARRDAESQRSRR